MRPPDAETTNSAILAIVDAYISAPPIPHRTTDMDGVRRDFLNSFFSGFTSPGAQMATSNDAKYYGFLAGQDFRSRGIAPEEEVMKSFGFELVSMKGRLFFGRGSDLPDPEVGFSPTENPGVRWDFGLLQWDGWPAKSEHKDGMEVVLKGYLSPERYYESRWIGDRKIFVLKTEVLGRGHENKKANPA